MSAELLWEPSDERRERAAITRYERWLREERGVELDGDDYDALRRWSIDNLEDFWASIWDYFDVEADTPYERVLGDRSMPGAEWFPGARLNYAQHVFRGKDDDEVAIRHASELRDLGEWTWGELRARTAGIAAGLRELGVGPGDRVVAYMPNIPEAVAAFLACASIGAIWSSSSPDFGKRSVVDRFAQIEPKVLLAVDGYRYGGKDFDRCDVVRALVSEMPSLERTVVLPYLGCGTIDDAADWDEAFPAGGEAPELEFEQLPFDHPLWVLYSSGHHRPAEADRARRRRHPARAAEAAAPAPRRAGRRPRVLVHHHRLDDVELPRRRPAHGGVDRALRRQPRHAGPGRALGPRRRRGRHHLRHERGVRGVVHEGRDRAWRRAAT